MNLDKKLILYLVILAGLMAATIISAISSKKGEENGELSSDEMELLLDTGKFDLNSDGDELIALNGDDVELSPEELGGGEKPSPELAAAYRKFVNESEGTSPIFTFAFFVLTGVFTGFLIITYVLPNLVQRASEEVYGSTEKSEGPSALARAQAKVAQGEWDEAIANFREAAIEDPTNRLPWIEIAMLQRERLDDPSLAVQTLDDALARGDWRENDEAFFIFRKIDLFENDLKKHDEAVALLRNVIERFPQTRHSANAMHKLHELGES